MIVGQFLGEKVGINPLNIVRHMTLELSTRSVFRCVEPLDMVLSLVYDGPVRLVSRSFVQRWARTEALLPLQGDLKGTDAILGGP